MDDLVTSPDGHKLAFVSNAINRRQEKYEDIEIYTIDLTNEAAKRAGVKLEWVHMPAGLDDALRNGRIDLWPLMTETPARPPELQAPREKPRPLAD